MTAHSEVPFPDPPLSDGVVVLRPWREQDTRQRFEGFADELCQRFSWARVDPITEGEVAAAYVSDEKQRRAGESLNLAIAEFDRPGRVLGAMSVYGVDREQRRAAIGYWLAPQARGRGLATRALRLLSGWTFGGLGVLRLELTCGPDNLASAAVARRCGFVREGVLRSHLEFKGARRDTVLFSLLPGELN